MATEVSELKKLLLDETASKNRKSREEEDQPADTLYFYEDEIFKIDKKGRVKFGLVIETEPYSDDDDDFDVLNKGEVLIAWYPEGREDVQSERTIGLADRSLMPGDVVRRLLPGKDTQRGYCREVTMRSDVKVLGTKYVIKNVPGERLRLITSWQRDSAVCLDSWVGSTKDFEEKAILRSTSGSRIEVSTSDFYAFKEASCPASRGIFNPHIFYPGNVVVGNLHSLDNVKLLTPKNPLPTNKKGKPLAGKFTIESVYTESVWVHWQYRALSDTIESNPFQQPNPCVTGEELKRLKRLNLFEPCMLQINDRNYLNFSLQDDIVKKSQWDKEQAEKFKVILAEQQKEENQNLFMHTGGPNSNSHHYEKLKKKMSLIDTDKTGKLKKCSHKDKLSNSVSKEKQQVAENVNCSTPKSMTDTEWMSDDEDFMDGRGQKSMEDEEEEANDSEIEAATARDSNCGGASRRFNSKDSTTTTLSTCSSPSPSSSPRHGNRRQLKRKPSKTLKSAPTRGSISDFQFKEGDEMVTEALLVYSTATVIWQDGTIEHNIHSTQLYPIHHLDNHEFFPGDFVISGKEESDVSFRDYGVIQTVDHHGRTARVKWFTTYTSTDEPKPAYKGETEVSVYDLKDHPDFQYRPGTMVIRVANFVGEDATCTAGQIIDNYIDGRVKVWWVDGHISMCWPQDLFEVGQYDHADWGHESEDSWETESENSEFGGDTSPKLSIAESHILSNIERARVAIARLEEIFNISPNLQSPDVMRKLLNVYKGCRYLDRLLSTNFFHEDNFSGLIERVRKGGTQSISERAQVRKNRLFSDQQSSSSNSKQQQQPRQYQAILSLTGAQKFQSTNSYTASSKDYAPKVLLNMSSTPFKFTSNSGAMSVSGGNGNTSVGNKRKFTPITTAMDGSKEKTAKAGSSTTKDVNIIASTEPSPAKQNSYNTEKNELLTSAMLNIEKAFEKTSQLKYALVGSGCGSGSGSGSGGNASSQDDSGNYSIQNCDGSSTSYASSSDLTTAEANSSLMKNNDDQKSISCSSIELTEDATPELVCVRLCTLLKDQLVKCINEIREKYYKNDNINLSEVFEYDIGEDENTLETIFEVHVCDKPNTIPENESGEATVVNALKKDALEDANVEPKETTSSVLSPPSSAALVAPAECFQILSNAPTTHKYHLTLFHPNNPQQYYKAVQKEHRMLKNCMPSGVWVRVFEDRMDLLSVMIEGPKNTPYEDGMFFFDIQLGREYPKSPPLCHYISYCSDRLNPNLYEDGKVCVSLLGTWSGRESEVWGPNSTLLQVIVSIQGLILVPEPYFNEAGYDKQKGTQQGKENSRMYNEMVIIKMVQATTKLLQQSPEMFRQEIVEHFKHNGYSMHSRIKGWMELSKLMPNAIEEAKDVSGQISGADEQQDVPGCSKTATNSYTPPDFPLVPASRGFCLTLAGLLDTLKSKLDNLYADAGGSNSEDVNAPSANTAVSVPVPVNAVSKEP